MKISRLDEIIRKNVAYSSHSPKDAQMVYILQDVSETLAMIYDHMCGLEPVSEGSIPVSTMAKLIPFDELEKYETMHFETVDYIEGYDVSFARYEQSEIIDSKKNEVKHLKHVVFIAFGNEMRLAESNYNKKWRCWNVKPTEEERRKTKWMN